MKYFYRVDITGDRYVHLKEMNLEQYKDLQKICIESDHDNFKIFISSIIDELIVGEIDGKLNLIDIYIIVLQIKKYSVSDEKVFTTFTEGHDCIITIMLDDLIEKVFTVYNTSVREYVMPVDNFVVDNIVVDPFLIDDPIVELRDGGRVILWTKEVCELIPFNIKNDIDIFIGDILKSYEEIELFTLYTSEGIENKIMFELSNSFIYEFLRIILKDDLRGLYSKLYDVKTHMNIGFDEHESITFSELELYITLYNKEQESSKETKQTDFPNMNL